MKNDEVLHPDLYANNRYLPEVDFARAFLTIGIVIFHTLNELYKINGYEYPVFFHYPVGNCGDTFVAAFFIMSGFLLYRGYAKSGFQLDQYAKKRWKSIFPAFYLSWLVFDFIRVAFRHYPFLWGGKPIRFGLTLIGMDGYFLYLKYNYYLVGEWFLGAIIILYGIFPVIIKIMEIRKKSDFVLLLCIFSLYIWQIWHDHIFIINSYRNMISCLVSFYIGILISKYYQEIVYVQANTFIVICEFFLYAIARVFIIPINRNILMHILGVIVFLILITIGRIIMSHKNVCSSLIKDIAKISFCIYLVHHRIAYFLVPKLAISMKPLETVLIVICILCLTLCFASFIYFVQLRCITITERALNNRMAAEKS